MASRKLTVLLNFLLIAMIFFVFQVAARELLDHSWTSVTSKTDRKLLNADFPWGHGYINHPPEKKN